MTYQERIRTKLQKKIFDTISKTVTLIKKTSPIYNTRGEIESYTSVQSTIKIVPYDITQEENSNEPFGTLSTGNFEAAVPYDTVVDKDDIILMESVNYKVTQVRKNYLPDNVVTIIRLEKLIA